MSERQFEELAKLRARFDAGEKLSNKHRKELKRLEAAEQRWKEYEGLAAPTAVDAMSNKPQWSEAAHSARNAGVMLVGCSSQHGGVPAVLLGGRFYTRKQNYAYTDFGGGVDTKTGETPQHGAFREFVEELFGYEGETAGAVASRLWEAAASGLVGGVPIVHNNGYAIFIVTAEVIVTAMCDSLPAAADGVSSIDQLFAFAKRNSELTSVALISIEEFIRCAVDHMTELVSPLSIRQLDGKERSNDEIVLRNLLVGANGSINTIRRILEDFRAECGYAHIQASSRMLRDDSLQEAVEHCRACNSTLKVLEDPCPLCMDEPPEQKPPGHHCPICRRSWRADDPHIPVGGVCDRRNCHEQPLQGGMLQVKGGMLRMANGVEVQAPRRAPRKGNGRMPYIFDMETGDPDDVLTLLFLGAHPDVDLKAVTITPGTSSQVALVRWLLEQMHLTHVRLGAQDWPANKDKPVALNGHFYQCFGRSESGEPQCERADQVLLECCDKNVTLVTGCPLHNLGAALKMDGFQLGRWVAQGGFAGEGVVPTEKQMDKFKGMTVCHTWNFGGSIQAAEAALSCASIRQKICVSKNVCHSVVYDSKWHAALGAAARMAPEGSLGLMHKAMNEYLQRKPGGKKLHDPLALAVALNESVCELAEVNLFCEKGKWGSRLCPGTNIWISIDYDPVRFQATLLPGVAVDASIGEAHVEKGEEHELRRSNEASKQRRRWKKN